MAAGVLARVRSRAEVVFLLACEPIGTEDVWVASTALEHRLTVMTRDTFKESPPLVRVVLNLTTTLGRTRRKLSVQVGR
jgi:predicted nucleic acid-binding protein